MPKSITGGDTGSGGGGSSTDTFTTLTAANFINTMTSPQASVGVLTATNATIPTVSVGVLTNTTSMTSPNATITSLTANAAAIPSLTSTAAAIGTLINSTSMTSPSATITSLTASSASIPALTSTAASVGTLTNTTSMTSPSATITSLTAPTLNSTTATISTVNSTNITNSAAISTYDLTSTHLIAANNVTVTGALTTAAYTPQKIITTVLNVGVAATSFPTGTSEYDATSIIYDTGTNRIGSSIDDKRTSFSAIQCGTGSDLGISIDDDLLVAAGKPNGINGAAAIKLSAAQTTYFLADTNATGSSNEMTIVAAIKLLNTDNNVSLVSYDTAQPSVNIAAGGNLFIERNGKFNLDTGITLSVGTNYILVVTISSTSGIKVRLNGVLQYTNTTSHGNYTLNPSLAFIGRHWLVETQLQYFIGRLGNLMTAGRLLTDTEINNVENYLSAKFQIAIGSIPTIADINSDPFSIGSGTMKVYGRMTTSNLATSGNLAVNGTSTLTGNVEAAGNLNVVGEIMTWNLSMSGTLSVNGATTLTGDVAAAGNVVCAQNIQSYTLQSDKLTTRGLYYEATIGVGVSSLNYYTLYFHNCGISYIPGRSNPTANFMVTIINVPVDTSATRVYTTSLLYYQTTTANYCNSVAVSDTGGNFIAGSASSYVTPLFSGGVPTFTTKPNLVIQTFSVISIPDVNGTVQKYVVSSVSPYY